MTRRRSTEGNFVLHESGDGTTNNVSHLRHFRSLTGNLTEEAVLGPLTNARR